MKRRTFIIGLGAAAAGGSAVLGTGAFTSTAAARSVTVETADDQLALLSLEGQGDGSRSAESGGTIEFSFPGKDHRIEEPDLGLGTDSVYEFVRDPGPDGGDSPEGLLRITNQGTQTVSVYSQFPTESNLGISLFDVADSHRTALHDDPADLGVGDFVDVGFRITTYGADIDTFEETLTIVAAQPDD